MQSGDEGPWHHLVYEDIGHWDDQRLIDTYRRLSRDLRIGDRADEDHYDRMGQVEEQMRSKGLDPRASGQGGSGGG